MVLGDSSALHDVIGDVAVQISDPPYSEKVHSRSIRRTYLPDVADQPCRRTRKHEFGFSSIVADDFTNVASFSAKHVKRWTLVFSDMETAHDWRVALEAVKLDHVRTGAWVKDRAMPQISGDRPGNRVELITIAHRKGKKRWNGGGLGNVWQHPVVANCNGHRSDRVHTAQKPETLMLELVGLFSDEGELVADLYAGSATTGVACLRSGRRFVGVEQDPANFDLCCERLDAETRGISLSAARAGQSSIFDRITGTK